MQINEIFCQNLSNKLMHYAISVQILRDMKIPLLFIYKLKKIEKIEKCFEI